MIALVEGRAAVAAAQEAEMLAQQTLDDEQKKYQLGSSTSYNVVLRSRDLTAAQGTLLRDRINLDRSGGELQSVHGTHARREQHHHRRRQERQSGARAEYPWRSSVETGTQPGETMTLRHLVWRLREEFYPEKHPYRLAHRMRHLRYDPSPAPRPGGRRLPARRSGRFSRLPRSYPTKISRRFTFIDIGCGKGRALLLAEEYDFRQNHWRGVFATSWRKSLRRMPRVSESQRISVVRADARRFHFPSGAFGRLPVQSL